MMPRGPRKTAAEFLAQFEPGPAAQARNAEELERDRQQNLAAYHEAAAPVLADLAAAGFPVATIGELRRAGPKARPAVPILARWLPVVTDTAVKADIVRALGVRWATAASPALLAEFRRAPAGLDGLPGPRWAVASALAETARDDVLDEIVALARKRDYGRDREMLVVALGNMRDPRAIDILLELTQDDETVGHAVIALGKLRAEPARSTLESCLDHPQPWVRGEAKKALARLR
jgi:HEAT repeat protein